MRLMMSLTLSLMQSDPSLGSSGVCCEIWLVAWLAGAVFPVQYLLLPRPNTCLPGVAAGVLAPGCCKVQKQQFRHHLGGSCTLGGTSSGRAAVGGSLTVMKLHACVAGDCEGMYRTTAFGDFGIVIRF